MKKTLFAATVLTAVLLSACDSAPLMATAAAEESPAGLAAALLLNRSQLCERVQATAQMAYLWRLNGQDRQALLDRIDSVMADSPTAGPTRDLVILIYSASPAQFESPAMRHVLSTLAELTCHRVIEAIIAQNRP